MRKFGLIGYPLSHSFSPKYFKEKFERESILNTEYKAYEIEYPEAIMDLFESGLEGLNVTIPYKETVIPFLDDLDKSALSIMAVNTIKKEGNNLIGYNTDLYGFENSIDESFWQRSERKGIILGTGGASKAIKSILSKYKFQTLLVSTSGKGLAYNDLTQDIIEIASIIINTTPLGMAPNVNSCPAIPYEFISDKHLVYDLIYNPEKTLFLSQASAQGASIQNGLAMLKLQAERSWQIWNNVLE